MCTTPRRAICASMRALSDASTVLYAERAAFRRPRSTPFVEDTVGGGSAGSGWEAADAASGFKSLDVEPRARDVPQRGARPRMWTNERHAMKRVEGDMLPSRLLSRTLHAARRLARTNQDLCGRKLDSQICDARVVKSL